MAFIRTCQECGNRQADRDPEGSPSVAFVERKCKKCKSPGLDYGSEDSEIDFHDTQNLVKELLKNREVLTRQEEVIGDALAPLSAYSAYRRRAVYQYINTMKERIRMLTEKVEEMEREAYEGNNVKTRNDNSEKRIQTHTRNDRENEESGEKARGGSETEDGEFSR